VSTVSFGVAVNNRAAVVLGERYSLGDLLDLAVLAEELGFDYVTVADSILAKPRHMPLPVLAGIAVRTRRIELMSFILQPHLRNPVLLAKDWTTLDVLAGGRTALGVGLGTGAPADVAREYELVGIPKARRGKAFEDAIEIIKRLWTEERVTYEGPVYSLKDVSVGYRPVREPHPPILIAAGGYIPKQAGFGPNDFYSEARAGTFWGPWDRVARLGDGWITGIITPGEYADALRAIKSIARERYGRVLGDDFRTIVNVWLTIGDSEAEARERGIRMLERYHGRPFDPETVDRWLIAGTPERCAERIVEFLEAGANSLKFTMADEDQIGQMRRLAEEVRPLVPKRS
jgi:alkanesulfonate monooxygenase SsuD/methylene tetrahydromethanopterin reductase-like flavin-dependent oxidoreductase (luciferase family)